MISILSFFFFLIFSSCSSLSGSPDPAYDLDCHVHVNNNSGGDLKFTPKRSELAYESAGFKRACLLPPTFLKGNNPKCWGTKKCLPDRKWVSSTHAWLAERLKKETPNSIGFCGIDPSYSWWQEELNHCSRLGFKGLKLHTVGAGFDIKTKSNAKTLSKISAYAGGLGMKVLIHSRFKTKEEAKALVQIVKENPSVTFIFAHMLGNHMGLLKNGKVSNAYLEISGAIHWPKTSEEKRKIVETWRAFGIERILFGSDWPVFHPQEALFALQQYPLSKKEVKLILSVNSKELFN